MKKKQDRVYSYLKGKDGQNIHEIMEGTGLSRSCCLKAIRNAEEAGYKIEASERSNYCEPIIYTIIGTDDKATSRLSILNSIFK